MDPHKRIIELLVADKAELIGRKNHTKFRLSNGRTFVMSVTPSDPRSRLRELTRLKRQLRES